MTSLDEFKKWFNKDFWKAFSGEGLPVDYPKTEKARVETVKSVYNSILTANYFPSIPVNEVYLNKGNGIVRIVPIFRIEDYMVFYFCIRELEDVLCVNRTPNTFGGWPMGGKFKRRENAELRGELTQYYSKYSFNPLEWARVFGEFTAFLYSQLDAEPNSHIVEFDA